MVDLRTAQDRTSHSAWQEASSGVGVRNSDQQYYGTEERYDGPEEQYYGTEERTEQRYASTGQLIWVSLTRSQSRAPRSTHSGCSLAGQCAMSAPDIAYQARRIIAYLPLKEYHTLHGTLSQYWSTLPDPSTAHRHAFSQYSMLYRKTEATLPDPAGRLSTT
eukprot:1746406-Rhodomonas_salina.3